MRSGKRTNPRTRRRGVALLTTVLLITLMIAAVAELVATTSTEAIVAGRRHRSIDHRLAVDGALIVLAERLATQEDLPSPLVRDLDQLGRAFTSFEIGEIHVTCTITDDGAKFSPIHFQRPDQANTLSRKLDLLARTMSLPPADVELRPIVERHGQDIAIRYRWFDQLLSGLGPEAVFRWDQPTSESMEPPVWSDALTFWGDGRVDLRRAPVAVVEAALEDIRPGLGTTIMARRPADQSLSFIRTALADVDAEIQQEVGTRVTFDARRYAIFVDTAYRGDHRRWYVVATITGDSVAVLHRSQRTW